MRCNGAGLLGFTNGQLTFPGPLIADIRRPNNAAIDALEISVRKQTDVGRQGNLQREQLSLRR